MTKYERICARYGAEYLYRQLAEEAAELTQAALKMVRALRAVETPVSVEDALDNVIEEMADVCVVYKFIQSGLMRYEAMERLSEYEDVKEQRMLERLLGSAEL